MLPAAGIEPGTKWFIVSYTHHCAISVLKVSMGCTRFAVFQDTWFNPGTLTEIVYTRSTDIQSAHQLSDSQKCAVIGTCDLQNSLHHAAHNMITAVHPVDAPFKLLYPWAFSELRDHEGKNKSSPAQLGGENPEFLIIGHWNAVAQWKTNRAESAFGIFTLMGVIWTIWMRIAFACVFPVPDAQRVWCVTILHYRVYAANESGEQISKRTLKIYLWEAIWCSSRREKVDNQAGHSKELVLCMMHWDDCSASRSFCN